MSSTLLATEYLRQIGLLELSNNALRVENARLRRLAQSRLAKMKQLRMRLAVVEERARTRSDRDASERHSALHSRQANS